MRLQSSQANCGPAALYNAACALGKKLSLEDAEKACKTTTAGTSVKQLINGSARLGIEIVRSWREATPAIAALLMRDVLRRGQVAIVCVDADDHWVAVVGTIGERFLVADSAESELVLSYSEGEFLQRWAHPTSRRPYFALVVQ